MPIRYNDGSAVRSITAFHYNDGSAVRTIQQAWYNDGTAVRLVYNSIVITVPSGTVDHTVGAPTDASAGISFASDGTISYNAGNSTPGVFAWATPTSGGIGNSYWILATLNSGLTPNGGGSAAVGSWLPLSSNRSWSQVVTGTGARTCELAISISADGGATTLASGSITINAEAS